MQTELRMFWIIAVTSLLALSAFADNNPSDSLVCRAAVEAKLAQTEHDISARDLTNAVAIWDTTIPTEERSFVTQIGNDENSCLVIAELQSFSSADPFATFPYKKGDSCAILAKSFVGKSISAKYPGLLKIEGIFLLQKSQNNFESWQVNYNHSDRSGFAEVFVQRNGKSCDLVAHSSPDLNATVKLD